MSIQLQPERAARFLRDLTEGFIILSCVIAIAATFAVWLPYLAGRLQ